MIASQSSIVIVRMRLIIASKGSIVSADETNDCESGLHC